LRIPRLLGQVAPRQQDLAEQLSVLLGGGGQAGDVLEGDHQLMEGGAGVDVLEGQHVLVAVGDGGGGLAVADLAEQAVAHRFSPGQTSDSRRWRVWAKGAGSCGPWRRNDSMSSIL